MDASADTVAAPHATLASLHPAGEPEARALAPALVAPEPAGVARRSAGDVLSALVRSRQLLAARDARGSLVGLATLRRHADGPLVGWAVLPDRVGEGWDRAIAAAATARALDLAPEAVCQAGARNLPARAVLAGLGYAVRLVVPGAPALHAVDRRRFEAGLAAPPPPRDPGTALRLGERCAPAHPADWRPRLATPAESLWNPITAGVLAVRRAGPGDEAAVAGLLPFGIVPSGSPESVSRFLLRTMEEQAVMIGRDPGGAPVASLNVSTGPRGGYEVGWCVAEGHRRLGYASAMAEAVLGVLFDAGAPSVSCAIDAWNVPSLRTAARLGFDAGRAGPDGSVAFTLTPEGFSRRPLPATRAALVA